MIIILQHEQSIMIMILQHKKHYDYDYDPYHGLLNYRYSP